MAVQNPNVPPHAHTRPTGDKHPNRRPGTASYPGGLQHHNTRHTTRFTVIGNHLAQHRELSLLAIGLGTHLQSLPKGAPADIKSLAGRFPEGTTRIAAALRELEAHGYLRRDRHRTPSGRIVTRTTSCNQPAAPGRAVEGHPVPPVPPVPAAAPRAPQCPEPPAAPESRRDSREPRPPRRVLPDVPRPACPAPAALQDAVDLLSGLRRHDPHLLLSAADTAHLAPGVVAWLEREVSPAAVRHALITDLPAEGLRRPAAFFAQRLTAQLPPPPPFRVSADPAPVRHPVRNCDGCDRGFRAPEPGLCRECRAKATTAVASVVPWP